MEDTAKKKQEDYLNLKTEQKTALVCFLMGLISS